MRNLLSLTILAFLLVFSITTGSVSAGPDISIPGDIDSTDPTMSIVFINPPNCVGINGGFIAHYDAIPFQVDAAGSYIFTLGSYNQFAVFYLYSGSFDPTSPLANCIAADNTYPKEIISDLNVGTQYYLVVVDEMTAQTGGHYNILGEGVGNVILGVPVVDDGGDDDGGGDDAGVVPVSSEILCRYGMPAGAVLQHVPYATTAYFAPDMSSATDFSLPAGNWFVLETSGDFSKVWITCAGNPVWIPTSAID